MKNVLKIALAVVFLAGLMQACKTIEECPGFGQVETEQKAEVPS